MHLRLELGMNMLQMYFYFFFLPVHGAAQESPQECGFPLPCFLGHILCSLTSDLWTGKPSAAEQGKGIFKGQDKVPVPR